MTVRKKVLAVIPFPLFPIRSGGQRRTATVLEAFSAYWDITCITVQGVEPPPSLPYRLLGWLPVSPLRYLYLPSVRRVAKEAKQADLLWIDQPFWAFWGVRVAKQLGIPAIVQAHNIEFQRFRSFGKPWWRVVKWIEKYSLQQADQVVFISKEDAALAQSAFRLAPDRCLVLPYGLPFLSIPDALPDRVAAFRQQWAKKGESLLLFYGVLDYAPNLQAVELLLTEIMPRLRQQPQPFRLLLAGKGLPDSYQQKAATHPDISVMGFVDDVSTLLASVDLVLNPVLTGGGVKTKVIEALGHGCAVVSTETGAVGIETAVCGEALHLVPDHDWEGFAHAVVEINRAKPRIPDAFFEVYGLENAVRICFEKLERH